jgi:hypothetical protein
VLPRTIAIGFTLVCFFLVLGASASASASSGNLFYVDASGGNDAHSGQSPALAWKTMAAVNAHRFLPGDHLYFHAGQEFAGMMRSAGSGTSAAPIVVASYSGGHLPRLVGEGGLATVLLADVSFWTLQDIEVTNDGRQEGKRTGILLEATHSGETVHGITIEHVHVYNVRGLTGEENSAKDTGGIGIFAPALDRPARFDGVLIEGCTIEHVDNIGIWLNTYPSLNPIDPRWTSARNEHIHITGNRVNDTGRNAIIVRQALAPIIEGNTVIHASARHHGNAIFTRSTRDAVIRSNEVSFTGTGPSGENAAFDADIDSLHTVIEYNWSHDNQGGLFSLCNNPYGDANVTDGTVVRFNVSENDGIRAFGFSGRVTQSTIYNNTVLIGPGHKEAIVEARPFSESKPRYADGATFFNNIVIILGEALYDFAEATEMRFDSNCIIGAVNNPFPESGKVSISKNSVRLSVPSDSWHALSAYKAAATACGYSSHREPETTGKDILGAEYRGIPFRGAIQP